MWYTPILGAFAHKIRKDSIVLQECPECGNKRYNCEISMSKRLVHCWVCGYGATAISFLKRNNLPIQGMEWAITEKKPTPNPLEELPLPNTYQVVDYVQYGHFLTSKGIFEGDIETYNLRCFDKMLIIPLYEGHKLVYYSRRNIETKRYNNPQIQKGKILPYYLGASGCDVVYLVEGAFDAISIHKLGFTSVMLLGTNMSKDQIKKLWDFGFRKVVVCLDGDVYGKALALQETLQLAGFDSYVIKFMDKEDPNDVYVKNPNELLAILSSFKKPSLVDRLYAIPNISMTETQ